MTGHFTWCGACGRSHSLPGGKLDIAASSSRVRTILRLLRRGGVGTPRSGEDDFEVAPSASTGASSAAPARRGPTPWRFSGRSFGLPKYRAPSACHRLLSSNAASLPPGEDDLEGGRMTGVGTPGSRKDDFEGPDDGVVLPDQVLTLSLAVTVERIDGGKLAAPARRGPTPW